MKGDYTSKTSSTSTFSSKSNQSELDNNNADNEPTYESDLRRIRNYHVVTTAALPWMTGTAVNPLLRAAHLLRRNRELQKERGMFQRFNVRTDDSIIGRNVSDDAMVGSGASREFTAKNESSSMDSQPVITTVDEPLNGELEMEEIQHCPVSPHSSQSTTSQKSMDNSFFSAATEELDNTSSHYTRQSSIPSVINSTAIGKTYDNEEDAMLMGHFKPSDTEPGFDDLNCYDEKENTKLGQVTLVVPWLTKASERRKLYGVARSSFEHEKTPGVAKEAMNLPLFTVQEEQEAYIRSWLAEDAGMPEEARQLIIMFYPARFHKYYNSLFALGDICDLIPKDSADVCILEEPEHLNWYRAGCTSWRDKFCHCVGIVHTNYELNMRNHAPAGYLSSTLLAGVNRHVVQVNCHRVVKLSGVLQVFAPVIECIDNIHGVREVYLREGERRRLAAATSKVVTRGNTKQRWIYFLGKLLWAKGFDQLLDLQSAFRERTGDYFEVDIFGSGPDECEIKRAFSGNDSDNVSRGWCSSMNRRRPCLPVHFMGETDHSSLAGDENSIFINPSLSEVLCTTTAEAIAMGKWAIIPKHTSNAFFEQFPNCLLYRNRREFVTNLQHALLNDPPHMSDKHASLLTWEAATTRFINSAAISGRDAIINESLRSKVVEEESTLKMKLGGMTVSRSISIFVQQ